jgi:predicted lipid-binding transport protein (Tim44 family)
MRAPLIAQVLQAGLSTRVVSEQVREELGRLMERQKEAPPSSSAMSAHIQDAAHSQATEMVHEYDPQRAAGEQPLLGKAQPSSLDDQPQATHASLAGTTIERDIRNVRTIFERWQRQFDTLDEPYISQLIQFMMDEHLQQVERLIQTMEHHK